MGSRRRGNVLSRALVTGGAGFLGFHLAQLLVARGIDVDLLENFNRGVRDDELDDLLAGGRVRLLERDLCSAEGVSHLPTDYEYIYHLAALVGVRTALGRPAEVLKTNVVSAFAALDLASRQARLRRFIFASTSEVYAGTLRYFSLPIPTPEKTALAIDDPLNPRTSYMASKIVGELACRYARVPFTIVRPHNVYGPRMGLSHVIPELLERAHRAKEGDALDVASVSHRRTFCFVSDAVELIRRAAESPEAEGEVLNVGRDQPEVSIGVVAEKVIEAVGKRLSVRPRPDTPGSPPRRAPDTARIRQITGFSPCVDLEEGIAETYRWYRTRVFEGAGLSAQ
jgi:UDP-glucose 4-epimerase